MPGSWSGLDHVTGGHWHGWLLPLSLPCYWCHLLPCTTLAGSDLGFSVSLQLDEEEERRKRRREKNKVAAARCRNKKKERTEFLQRVGDLTCPRVQWGPWWGHLPRKVPRLWAVFPPELPPCLSLLLCSSLGKYRPVAPLSTRL